VRKLGHAAKGAGKALTRDHLYGTVATCNTDGLIPRLEKAVLAFIRQKNKAFEDAAAALRPADLDWVGALREGEMMEGLLKKLGALEKPSAAVLAPSLVEGADLAAALVRLNELRVAHKGKARPPLDQLADAVPVAGMLKPELQAMIRLLHKDYADGEPLNATDGTALSMDALRVLAADCIPSAQASIHGINVETALAAVWDEAEALVTGDDAPDRPPDAGSDAEEALMTQLRKEEAKKGPGSPQLHGAFTTLLECQPSKMSSMQVRPRPHNCMHSERASCCYVQL
jgi:hypothetical protein